MNIAKSIKSKQEKIVHTLSEIYSNFEFSDSNLSDRLFP